MITFKTAAEVATANIAAMYGPIFAQIEPEKLGSRTRAMRIAADYAERLSNTSGNIQNEKALDKLSNSYASHSFVIDFAEAETLFNNVRMVNDDEAMIVKNLGGKCRFPQHSKEPIITCLNSKKVRQKTGETNGPSRKKKTRQAASSDTGSAKRNKKPSATKTSKERQRRTSPVAE